MPCARSRAVRTLHFAMGLGLLVAGCIPGTIENPCPQGAWIDEVCIPRDCPDRICPDGFICRDDTCQEVACLEVACAAEEVCAGGECFPRDCDWRTCPGVGEVCVDEECQPASCVGVVCPPDQLCAAGQCYPSDCHTFDCPGYGVVCIAEQCIERSCIGVECPPDQACAGGYCFPIDCADAGCFGQGEVCVDGVCTRRACVDVRCQPGYRCADGFCFPVDCAGLTCSPQGEVCMDGACVPADCVDVECEGRERCARGECFDTVCGLTTCEPNEVCFQQDDQYRCTQLLCVGVECPPGQRCADGACLPEDCLGTRCGVDEVCLDSQCIPEACAQVVCPAGEVCGADRRCYPLDCLDRTCGDYELCLDGACTDRLCVGVSCPAAERCAAGDCHPLDCAQPCGPHQVCIDQECTDAQCAGCRCCPSQPCTLNEQCETVDCCGQSLTCLYDEALGLPVWSTGSNRCSDMDPCTLDDLCRLGACGGLPIECRDPPGDTCAGLSRTFYPDLGVCVSGACEYPAYQEECETACLDGRCVGETCGAVQCDSGELCVAGVCSCGGSGPDCNPPQGCCQTSCVQLLADPDNCGVCGNDCGPNATCQGGACACPFPRGNCDADWSNGCETDTQSSLEHCGGCGRPCPIGVHSDRACTLGQCRYTCHLGWDDCDAEPATCETDVSSDGQNCGACGYACGQRARCISSACVCDDGWGDCNASQLDGCETDLRTSQAHCGGCQRPCYDDAVSSAACINGVCERNCNWPMLDCDGDPGTCETNASSDPNHCGDCTTACSVANGSPSCTGGSCGVASCDDGWCDLDGQVPNGCEHDLDTDPACGNFLSLGAVSGDDGSDHITEIARGERVYRLHVQETYNNMFNCRDLSAVAQLNVPAGTDYDLLIYCDNCNSTASRSEQPGSVSEQVYVRWEEGCIFGVPDGGGDDRYVYIRVIYRSGGLCSEYTLDILGNTSTGGTNCSQP